MTDLTRDELRQQWLDALRSGEYEQANYQLKMDDAYCCLGVLCDVYDPERWVGDDYLGAPREDDSEGAAAILPPGAVWDAIGLTEEQISELASLNDGDGDHDPHTFNEIADVLEGWFEEGDDG